MSKKKEKNEEVSPFEVISEQLKAVAEMVRAEAEEEPKIKKVRELEKNEAIRQLATEIGNGLFKASFDNLGEMFEEKNRMRAILGVIAFCHEAGALEINEDYEHRTKK